MATLCVTVRNHACPILSAPEVLALAFQKHWFSILEWGPQMGVFNRGPGEPRDPGRLRNWLSSTSKGKPVLPPQGRVGRRLAAAQQALQPHHPARSLLPPPAP